MPTVPDRREVVAVYAAGLAQGVALVTFPAASSILTSPSYYDLSSTAYGGLFLPQAIAAIAASLAGARLAGTLGPKRLLLIGLAGDLLAMTLLFLSQFLIGAGPLPYLMLLAATTSLGHRVRVRGAVAQHLRGLVLPGDARTARSCTSTPCWGWAPRSRRCSWPCSSAWASGPACRSSSRWPWPCSCCSPGRSRSRRRRRPARLARAAASGSRPRSGSSPRSRSATASSRR